MLREEQVAPLRATQCLALSKGDMERLQRVFDALCLEQGWARDGERARRHARMLIDENRWRAQRYGIDQGLVDFGRREIVPYGELLGELIALVAEDAAHFGCTAEVEVSPAPPVRAWRSVQPERA